MYAGGQSFPEDTSKRLIDVVVPTHARPDLLHRLLTALAPQLRSVPMCRAIIVNDGTHDASYNRVIPEFEDVVKYVPLASSRGPAHARNVGARESDAEYVAFTDDDCLPPSHWLDWLVARIETSPEADVIGGTTIPPEAGRRTSAIERYNRALRWYPRPLFFRGEMHCLPTATVAVKRTAFVRSGGFDEYFRFPAGEDTEFFYRMRYLGFRFLIDPLWQTEHPIADSLRSFLRRHYRYGYGNAQHRIRTGDPFQNGVPPNLTVWRIIRELPAHVRGCRARLAGRAEPDDGLSPRAPWNASFTVLAVAQRLAYRYGAYKAYRTEGLGLLAGPPPKLKTARANAAEVLAGTAKKPDIPLFGLIVGAMKCGTSALYSALRSHPQIAASHIKEPRFFLDDREFAKGKNWYRDLFDFDPDRHAVAMEASVGNAMRPVFEGCASRMLKTGWAFRFVYIVRDPIERIQSHYLHAAVANLELPPLADGVHPSAIDISRYHWQLAPYRKLFGRGSILVVSHEDWVAAPDETLRQVCCHFGIDLDRVGRSQTIHSSEYHYRRRLRILELKKLGLAPSEISLDTVPQVMADLPRRIRRQIETAVEAHYRLTSTQVETIRQALSEDMRRLRKDYRIEVSRWGFDV